MALRFAPRFPWCWALRRSSIPNTEVHRSRKDPLKQTPVGLDINANHLKSVQEGAKVFAKVSPIHLGRKTHVWHIDIHDEKQNLVCVSRLTMMILHRP